MKPKKILIVGGSGFIGNEVGIRLVAAGYEMRILSRNKKKPGSLSYPAQSFVWNDDGSVPDAAMAGVEAVINLSGESIATGRWTQEKRRKILESRVRTTERIVEAINKHEIRILLQTSAIGFYGDSPDQVVDELSPPGSGFLADICRQWEEALADLNSATRCAVLRTGVVLGTTGGALQEMMTPYAVGAGAALGSGKQFFSWIHVEDHCRFIQKAIEDELVQGVYNLTAPNPITYQDLHHELTDYFGGFKWMRVPAFALKLALGEKSSMLLMSQNVEPKRTLATDFNYKFPDINSCLTDLLRQHHKDCAILDVKQWVPSSHEKVWNFFSSEGNLETLTPPFLKFRVEGISTPEVQEGSEIKYKLRIHGVPVTWRSKILNFKPGKSFEDIQLSGPYHTWHHTHEFIKLGDGVLIRDFIKYKVPLGMVGGLAAFPLVKRDIGKIFKYRRKKIVQLFCQEST